MGEITFWHLLLGLLTGGVLVAILNRVFAKADIHRTESAVIEVRKIDDAAALRLQLQERADRLEQQREEANLRLMDGMQDEISRLSNQVDSFQQILDESRRRETQLKFDLDKVSKLQAERIEQESLLRIENEQLKAEIRELKESIRSSIEFYEAELTKKEKEIFLLKNESGRQAQDIEKMKTILAQHQIVLDEH